MEEDSELALPNSFPAPTSKGEETAAPLLIPDQNLLLKTNSRPPCESDGRAQTSKVSSYEVLPRDGDLTIQGSDKMHTCQKKKLHVSSDLKMTIPAEDVVTLRRCGREIDSESSVPTTASSHYAPKAVFQSTPLSSLPRGSLMRHLAGLREKQYLLSRCSPDDGPKLQGSALTLGETPPYFDLRTFAPKFTTSTPQVGSSEALWIGQDGQRAIRYPLAELPINTCTNIVTTASAPNVGLSNKTTASKPLFITNENSLPGSTFGLADLATSRFYDPNTYRSPPKLTSNVDTKKCFAPELQQKGDSHLVGNSETSVSASGSVQRPPHAIESCNSPRDDDRPLSSSNKSFEELLSEKLEDKSYSASSSAYPGPSKKFLKKGSGVSRFANVESCVTNGEKSGKKDSSSLNDLSIARKPKFPFLKKGTGTRRYNIKSVRLKKSIGAQPSTPASDNICESHQTVDVRRDEAPNEMRNFGRGNDELDFMSPIQRVSIHRESEELKAFEALEELAEHSSFCSDASTVNSLLRRGFESSVSSTPAGSPSTRHRRYATNILELEARRLVCTDSPHPQRGGGVGYVAPREESAKVGNSESGGGLRAKKSVQFCTQGAQVLEYRPHEDTVDEAPPLSDASDVLSVSDLEFLNQMNDEGKLPDALRVESVTCSENTDSTAPTDMQDVRTSERHQILQFSPPRMPPDSASYAVWEAFGKRSKSAQPRQVGFVEDTKAKPARPAEETSRRVTATGAQNIYAEKRAVSVQRNKEEELEAHKVLLVSKVHELEKEIKTFQNENAVLAKLRKTFARKKEFFEREKRLFEETLERERKNMKEQYEAERNRLWREKCTLESNKQIKPQKDNVLEIINLKEEILVLKNELEKRESMNNFTVNKLKNKVKELTSEKKDLESKVQKISSLEKENMSLKHQVDRLRLTSRSVYEKPAAKPKPTVCHLNSAPASYETSSKAHGKLAGKVGRGNVLAPKSVSFVDQTSASVEKSASMKSTSFEDTTGAKKSLVSIESYLANFPCEESESKTPTSGAHRSSSSLSYTEKSMSDGSKMITYANGNKKQILPSGCVIHEYYNGDRKETYRDRVVYFYSFNGTKQTTYLDGSEELQFPNGQTEIKRADTSIEVIFPDKSKTVKLPDGTEVHHNSDGTVVTSTPSGEKVFKFPSGQREVHGLGFKRREYPDGTTKVLYDDGSSETTYPNGRIRIKDQHGNIVSDTKLGIDLTEKFPAV